MNAEDLDILLVRPVSKVQQIVAPLSLGYLATALRKENFSVEILDCPKMGFDYERFGEYVEQKKPRAIGFQTFTVDLVSVKKSIEFIKAIDPSIIAIVGGPHPSGVPRETLEYLDKVDFGFCGEAEEGLVQLMRNIRDSNGAADIKDSDSGKIPGLIWRDGGNINRNPNKYVDDLDSLGFPSWDLIQPQTYPQNVQGYFFKRFPVAPIIATRGCPYDCTFCAAKLINAKVIRKRSISNVIEEVKLLYHEYGIREIHILDDNFTFYRDYAMEFCVRLIEADIDITWRYANSIRLDTIDEELLKMMKRAGCYCLAFGVESGSDRILSLMKKRFAKEEIIRSVELASSAGFDVNGSFILGYPGETEQEIEETIRFSRSLPLKMANFNCFIPLPGTESYNELMKAGKLKDFKWEDFNYSNVAYVPEGMTAKRLKGLQRKAILLFYLRPKILLNLLWNIRSLRHLIFIMKAAFKYLSGSGGSKGATA